MEPTAAPQTESPESTGLPGSLASRAGFLLAKAHMRAHDLASVALKPEGLNVKHFGCLTVIADEGPISQQTLGDRMRVDRTTIVMVVDDLERKGLVVRRRNPADRRAYALEATAEGQAWLRTSLEILLGVEDEFLAPLDERERDQLLGLLRKIVTA